MNTEITPRQRKLLVLLGSGDGSLDPVRVMKALFLFEMKAPEAWRPDDTRYAFVPYNYGPFSAEVYRDLEQLAELGYVLIEQAPNRSWNYYSLTSDGKAAAEAAASALGPLVVEYLHTLYDFVTRVSFRDLLEAVYRDYPAYAENSVFK